MLDTLSVKNSLMMLMVQKKPGLRLADICELFSEGLRKNRLSRHPRAASSTPDPAVADCAELALEAINKVDLVRLKAMLEHIPPSVAIQRMRERGRDLVGVTLVPHDEMEFGEVRRPDHVGGGVADDFKSDVGHFIPSGHERELARHLGKQVID